MGHLHETEIAHVGRRAVAAGTERTKIAVELHDNLAPRLAAVTDLAEALARNLRDDGSKSAEQAEKIVRHLEETLTETRNLARGLYPVAPEAGSLETALEQLTTETAVVWSVRCETRSSRPRVRGNFVALNLYRIAQEAISNAIRHGQATVITVELRGGKRPRLVITDNGSGTYSGRSLRPAGIGPRTMHYRSQLCGLKLTVTGGSNGGRMKNYYAYIRVSTVKQGEKGSSLQEQRGAIEGYARNGLTVSQWFEEKETAAKRGRRVYHRSVAGLLGDADSGTEYSTARAARLQGRTASWLNCSFASTLPIFFRPSISGASQARPRRYEKEVRQNPIGVSCQSKGLP